ncbi:CLUMA_CG016696, isoform A [Clunio marinus]|uniref:CLUMA_CG016696, isoform A n=1 Tax=Clunio marinus TaxID=568069 RepID=A0A1J1IWG9_9DIPT|nr:CLUMA_CG016696, isoform A [Clunio marinus]
MKKRKLRRNFEFFCLMNSQLISINYLVTIINHLGPSLFTRSDYLLTQTFTSKKPRTSHPPTNVLQLELLNEQQTSRQLIYEI